MTDNIQLTSQCQLIVFREEHSSILLEGIKANTDHLAQWLPWVSDAYSKDDVDEYIQSVTALYARRLAIQFAIIQTGLSGEQLLIGSLGFHQINQELKEGSIGYWLAKDLQGKGLMTKAVAKLIAVGFDELNLESIVLKCAVANDKSKGIALRLGFSFKALLKNQETLASGTVDHLSFTLTKQEYLGKLKEKQHDKSAGFRL